MIFDPRRIKTDERVNMALDACTQCGAKLSEHKVTNVHDRAMLAFNQCPKCKTVFIVGDMALPAR